MTELVRFKVTCPHGDPYCPCQDGDLCHYEGVDCEPCPNPPVGAKPDDLHCHLEGCRYGLSDDEMCGLARLIGINRASDLPYERGNPNWICGAARFVETLLAEGLFD